MTKIDMLCPFTHRLCTECVLYRGRHYYLGSCKQYRGYMGKLKEDARPDNNNHSADLLTVWKYLEPWSDADFKTEPDLKIKLKVIDMENETTEVCGIDEARSWDWSDPTMMRMIDGFQITSWDRLVKILSYKVQKGFREVEVYVAPRFMLLGGG